MPCRWRSKLPPVPHFVSTGLVWCFVYSLCFPESLCDHDWGDKPYNEYSFFSLSTDKSLLYIPCNKCAFVMQGLVDCCSGELITSMLIVDWTCKWIEVQDFQFHIILPLLCLSNTHKLKSSKQSQQMNFSFFCCCQSKIINNP